MMYSRYRASVKDFRLARLKKIKARQKAANLNVSHLLNNDCNSHTKLNSIYYFQFLIESLQNKHT